MHKCYTATCNGVSHRDAPPTTPVSLKQPTAQNCIATAWIQLTSSFLSIVSTAVCVGAGEETERNGVQETVGHMHRVRQHRATSARQEQQVSDGKQATAGAAGEECHAGESGFGRQ